MKTTLIAGVALVLTAQFLTAQAASAADLPVKSPRQTAPAAIAYDWSEIGRAHV